MLWKLGCATMLLGIVVGFTSCAFLGKAVSEATDAREIANMSFDPSSSPQPLQATVDPDGLVRVKIRVTVDLPKRSEEEEARRAGILPLEAPINYEVVDIEGNAIARGGGSLSGSVIYPKSDSSHYENFERRAELSFEGAPFQGPEDGRIFVHLIPPTVDDDGNPIRRGSVEVFDNVSDKVGSWVGGGVASMLLGPLIGGLGFLMFGIGVIVALIRKGQRPSADAP